MVGAILCIIKYVVHNYARKKRMIIYLLSPGRLLGSSSVTFAYRNDTRRTQLDTISDMLLHILTKLVGISMDIFG